MINEINEIKNQFRQGNGEWHQFLKSIKISNIHGWIAQEIVFSFPVVAIVGENGIGKSTFLKAAVCAYKNKSGKDFYPSNMFIKTQWDEEALSGALIEYKVRLGNMEKTLRWKKTNDWGYAPKKAKPERSVYFLDIARTLPLDATAGYAKIAKQASAEAGNDVQLNETNVREFSYVLGQNYESARFVGTNIDAHREIGLLTREFGEISQFHQGAGEDAMLDTFKLLQTVPNQSLLVIDEVENSLHPQAQRRFVRYLLKLSRVKKLQIILSTHSPFVLDELPEVARIMLVQLADRKDVLYGISTNFALSTIDDENHPDLFVFMEDDEAIMMFWTILKSDMQRYDEYCKRISTKAVGPFNVVNQLGCFGNANMLPYNSLAIVDGDKKEECPSSLALPGEYAPERQVLNDLKLIEWGDLEHRFGIGAGILFKVLDDAMLLTNHHDWLTYIGNQVRKSKDVVWQTLLDEWYEKCIDQYDICPIMDKIRDALTVSDM